VSKKPGSSGKIQLTKLGDRPKTNEGLYNQLVTQVHYVIIAKNGSYIPCVPVHNFSVINKELPNELIKIRRVQAHTWTGKLDGNAWRLSHGNDKDNLPEFNVTNKRFANERDDSRSTESHKVQQFQEYDVSVLCSRTSSKEVSDLGAMRVIGDECFEHVYFTIEHYRPTVQGKVTVAHKSGKKSIDAFNPYIFVLFELPPPEEKVSLKRCKKKEPTLSPTDQMFSATNIVEVKEGTGNKFQTAVFNGKTVTVLYPAAQKRGRANSFQLPRPPVGPIIVSTLEELAKASNMPYGAVEHAAMVLMLSPTEVPAPSDWERILAFVKVHYGIVGEGTLL